MPLLGMRRGGGGTAFLKRLAVSSGRLQVLIFRTIYLSNYPEFFWQTMPAPLGVSFARDPTLKISVLSLPSFKGRLGMGGADRKLKAMLHGMIRNLDLECYNNVPKMF